MIIIKKHKLRYQILRAVIFTPLFLFFSSSFAQTPTYADVDYVGSNNSRQKLDLYIPPSLSAPAPVIIHIPGGGWATASKGPANFNYMRSSYNGGFICVDINYRWSSQAIWPAQIEDCKAAVRYLKANASLYGIDTCRIGVMGGSAGGHLATMLGVTAGVSALEGNLGGNTNVTSRVHAVIDLFGPTDFSHIDDGYDASCTGTQIRYETNSYVTRLLGISSISSSPTRVQSANPIAYLTPDDAKFFIVHGLADCIVTPRQSILLNDALRASGLPVDSLLIVPNEGHVGAYFTSTQSSDMYRDFLQRHLSTPCQPIGLHEATVKILNVFPNPAASYLSFNSLDGISSVKVFDALGQEVLNPGVYQNFSISELENGVYTLLVSANEQIYTARFVKAQ